MLEIDCFGALPNPHINFCSYRILLVLRMNWVGMKKGCLHAEYEDICNMSL